MDRERKTAGFFLRSAQMAVIAGTLGLIWQVCQQFDGYFFPVITNVELISVEPSENGGVDVQTSYHKARQCDHIRTDWFIGRPGQAFLTTSQLVNAPDRAAGVGEDGISHRSIRMSEVNFLENSFAVTVHDCYGGWLWETETLYWDRSKPSN